jgi:hypothetical protein
MTGEDYDVSDQIAEIGLARAPVNALGLQSKIETNPTVAVRLDDANPIHWLDINSLITD